MSERKPITKKARFEVFKRDSFTCQYCGASAPDVILHVDHIKPVATGGDNDITNLITACVACNSGKGARELDDRSVIARQKEQLDALNERREQLEMMLEWRESLANYEDEEAGKIAQRWSELTGYSLTEFGMRQLKKWIKRFGASEVLSSMDTSFNQYIEHDDKGAVTSDSVNKAFDYIGRIMTVSRATKDKPWMKDLFYVRGILRRRLSYLNERRCIELLEYAYDCGVDIDALKDMAKYVRNWTQFQNEISYLVEESGDDHGED